MEASKIELDAVKRAEQEQADTLKQIVGNMKEVAKTIGTTDTKVRAIQDAAEKHICDLLDASRKLGLNAKMLSGRGKTKGVAYAALVTTLQKCGKYVSDATRDNYMSKIRTYVENAGAKPLDLYGNIYTAQQESLKKAKAAADAEALAKLQQEKNDAPGHVGTAPDNSAKQPGPVTTIVPPVETKQQKLPPVIESGYKGALPLIQFGRAWIEENQGVAALEKLCAMLSDVVAQAEVLMPKK